MSQEANDPRREREIASALIEYKAAQIELSLARAQLSEAYHNEEAAYERIKALGATPGKVEE